MFSWTGLSRVKDIQKQPFNKLHHTLSLFYDVIVYADSSFSHKHKEEFFRDGVLKHSCERNKPKKERTSTKKSAVVSAVYENMTANNTNNNITTNNNNPSTSATAYMNMSPVVHMIEEHLELE